MADSQFCIEYLAEKLGKDLSENLSSVEKAIARAFFQLCDESIVWIMTISRFVYGKAEDCGMPSLLFKLMNREVKKRANIHGYGRHSKDESNLSHKKKLIKISCNTFQ